MWIFTKHGFYSAVQHTDKANVVLVRARFKGDLESLCKTYDITPEVKYTPAADYLYRMEFKKELWSEIVAKEAADIDYPNFKSEVHDGTERDTAYMGCWASLRRAQG